MIYRIACALIRLGNALWLNITYVGMENIPSEGGVVLCPNHVSWYDPLLVGAPIRRVVHFLAKQELFKNKFFSWVLKKLVYSVPVNRENVSIETIKTALKLLKSGEILGVFPEGTRVKENERVEPLEGFVLFALKTKSPILPVHISGSFGFRGKVRVRYGELIYLDEFYGKKLKSEEMKVIAKEIMNKLYQLD